MDSHDFDNIPQLSLITREEIRKRDQGNHVDCELTLDVSFGDFCKVSDFVVLVFWLELEQELNTHVHSENDIKYYIENGH